MMSASQQLTKRRRLTLSLMVMLLLHWTFSSCTALADTLCLEPDGVVVWEHTGEPCPSAVDEKSSETPCVDFQAQDGHNDHASLYSTLQLSDPPALIQPFYTNPAYISGEFSQLKVPDGTGPPVKPFSIIIRETAYLHI
ncbi:hypothetical protein ACFQ0F_01735 [Paraperlucidibaca wandonensis]|mgnify:CR=1 FL=1|jgi:hypothetical protein|uniref:Uncharacterized protein n=3 Tax=Paraperlucidibaca TaxID=1268272 RepID=A0A3E0H0Q1_9GAMM|nr:hypothetical protein DFR26_2150 [Paraperlucidibaca baekdonensis]